MQSIVLLSAWRIGSRAGCGPHPPNVWFSLNCGRCAALPRTTGWGQLRTLAAQEKIAEQIAEHPLLARPKSV